MRILKVEILLNQTSVFSKNPLAERGKETIVVLLKGAPEDFQYTVAASEWMGGTKLKENSFNFYDAVLAEHRFEQEVLSKLLKGYIFAEDGDAVDIDMRLLMNKSEETKPTTSSIEHRKLTV